MQTKNIGIIGSGVVGQSLGAGFANLGYNVKIGIKKSYLLEALALIWIIYGFRNNYWNHAWKLLMK